MVRTSRKNETRKWYETRKGSSKSSMVTGTRNQERKTKEEIGIRSEKRPAVIWTEYKDAQDLYKWKRCCKLADPCKQEKMPSPHGQMDNNDKYHIYI